MPHWGVRFLFLDSIIKCQIWQMAATYPGFELKRMITEGQIMMQSIGWREPRMYLDTVSIDWLENLVVNGKGSCHA